MTATRTPPPSQPQTTFYLITHMPPRVSWLAVCPYLFNGEVNESISVYEQLRDRSKCCSPEGEYPLVIGVTSALGRRAVHTMVQRNGFRLNTISESLANGLIAQYGTTDKDMDELADDRGAGTSASASAR